MLLIVLLHFFQLIAPLLEEDNFFVVGVDSFNDGSLFEGQLFRQAPLLVEEQHERGPEAQDR